MCVLKTRLSPLRHLFKIFCLLEPSGLLKVTPLILVRITLLFLLNMLSMEVTSLEIYITTHQAGMPSTIIASIEEEKLAGKRR